MLSLRIIPLVILVAVLVQYASGNQRIVHVSELISDDEDFFASEDDNSHICCVYGNCSCNSLNHALTNLTSNVLIKITTDVTLSSLVKVSDIENVTIIGHNNPTVNCKDFGKIHLNFCNNCIIQGITWDGRFGSVDIDDHTEPVLKLSNSSNITIDNCSFQYSKRQAVVLSEVSGDVNIDHCNFVHNNHYRGHGAAIHYSSSNVTNCHQLSVFTISDCNFTYNYAKSLVYIENTIYRHNVTIHYTKFCHNQGISVYAVNQNIYLNGEILFQNNTAENGTAIHISDHSTVIFSENSDVTFTQNFAKDRGGTVFLRNHSNVVFDQNSVTVFNDNIATYYGGAIYSEVSSNITFKANCKVTFSNNSAKHQRRNRGGAMYSTENSYITFEGNSSTVFSNNTAHAGGAVASNSYILFEENSSTVFSNNIADVFGGAIHSDSYIMIEGNSSTVFSNNIAHGFGGAIHSDSYIMIEGNTSTVFSNNIAHGFGGAIHSDSYIMIEGNSSTVFSNNIAHGFGGAIHSDSYIMIEGNSSTVFSNNTAGYDGGAILSGNYGGAIHPYSYIMIKGNSSTVFSNNTAGDDGGAILSKSYILFEGNSSTVFSNNSAGDDGGAILSGNYIHFEGNSSTVFSNNSAGDDGGAILSKSYILFEGNSSTVFSNNIAGDNGGAIAIDFTSFEGFSTVVFRNNSAEYGGAVFASGHSLTCIIFSDNSAVTFTNNKATFGETVFSSNNPKVKTIGNSTVTFNDLSAKWCNNTCLPYTGQGGVVTIDSNGIVWCSDQKSFICLSMKCYCNKLEDLLDDLESNALVNITDNVTLSSFIELNALNNISVIGYNNITVICVNSGGLKLFRCNNVTIEGITWIRCGSYDNINYLPVINLQPFLSGYNILIQKCTFQYSLGIAISLHYILLSYSFNVTIKHCNFMNNNQYKDHGAAIYYNDSLFLAHALINIINCTFSYNGIAKSITYFDTHTFLTIYFHTCNFYNNQGVSVYLSRNTSLHVSGDVLFENNVAENGAGIYISDHSIVTFVESSNVKLVNNSVYHNGAAIFVSRHSNVIFEQSSVVTFNDNKASNGTVYCKASSTVTFKANCNVTFSSNSVTQYGAAVYSFNNSHVTFTGNSKVTFNDNKASNGTVYCEASSNVTFKANCNVTFSSNSATQYGAAIYSFDNSHVTFTENSKITFNNNIVSSNDIDLQRSGTIYSENNGYISFEDNSVTVFSNNIADYGAAIFSFSNSHIIFKDNSRVTFNDNKATNGTVYSEASSNVTFKGTCEVIFSSNSVTQYGAAIYSVDNSYVTFTENSEVIFSNNVISSKDIDLQYGGTIYSENNGLISFEGNSFIGFSNNTADFGAAILSYSSSSITFKDSSRVMFNNNMARYCGVLTSLLFSSVIYKDYTEVIYNGNEILCTSTSSYEPSAAASAMCTFQRTDVTFSGYSLVTYTNNTAGGGGAIVFSNSNVIIEEYSTVTCNNNIAQYSSGGAFICYNSNVTIKGNSNVTFNSNNASQNGGAIYSYNMCKITFKDNSTSTFIKNAARNNGGAMFSSQLSEITVEGNSTITFDDNTADNGGAFYFANSNITITETSMVSFYNNKGRQEGGAGYLSSHCIFIVEENAKVIFDDNKAFHGGAICSNMMSKLIFKGNSTTSFHKNLGTEDGGAVTVLNNSSITVKYHVTIKFTDNSAQYGGAIFLDTTATMVNNSDIDFKNNFARILGSSVYEDVAEMCNSSCLYNRITGLNNTLIATPPYDLKFDDPATCIDNDIDNDTQCKKYYVQNIMLGKEIAIPVCVLDYYNQPADSIYFLLHETHPNNSYSIKGAKNALISCDMLEGISIIGNQSLSKSTNFSINITLNTDLYSDWKQISVNLIIELSPCHPGFWQYPNSMECECYNANDIMFCSGSNSTIKRGYWFGSVTGKPTVTFCPINYCNFTCCETSNGYYHLSPVRDNQCRSHRSGTACGSCTQGYTLSFDSPECVNVDSCTAGQTILVILLIVIYWIVMVTLVFAMMYYKVEIGYLYSITYYYSIVDVLLSQNLQATRGLYLTVSIISSFSKITPQFLGELCLTTGMSGIDQQFIHYIHPSAVIMILVIITFLARIYRRISIIISRGIIHVICLLLLLSYTSIASTSLQLMRSLIFHGIDKVYTYLSPDIEYFHGRHLAYGIVALLCTVTIALGLPLLLTLEPFLNRKINFIKIKPLLDQFQGCYKDKYRCFAGYYMICRLLIITIVIVNSSNEFVANYLLTVVCGIIDLIHVTVKPYSKKILNKFDSIILHLIIFVAALTLLDDIDSPSVMTTVYALVVIPLLIFFGIIFFLHKDDLKKIIKYFTFKHESPNSSNDVNVVPMREFDLIVDDSMRINATICDIK